MEELKNVHYDAFISYRHCELDSFVAEKIHKKLEAFRLPRSVRSKVKNGKHRIERIFRDLEELPLSDNLMDPITNALNNSDYLITICSPRYLGSIWCMKEIEVFLQTHDREHVLVILAEGEPEESFPEILKFEDLTTVDENGNTITSRRELEPLAADVRSTDKKNLIKAIDNAVIKLSAEIFELNYDDLKRRHRKQKLRKMAIIFGSIFVAQLIFAIVVSVMLIKISNQKDLISEQNEQMSEQNKKISEQNEEISAQYRELQDKYAASMATVSETLMGEGKRKDAAYALRSVLPDNLSEGYNPTALERLYSVMDPYEISGKMAPDSMFSMDGEIESYSLSYDGKYIAINDGQNICVFDADSGNTIKKIEKENTEDAWDDQYFTAEFSGNDGLIVINGGNASYVNLSDTETKPLDYLDPYCVLVQSSSGKATFALSGYDIKAVNNKGEQLYCIDLEEIFDGSDFEFNNVCVDNGNVSMSFTDFSRYYIVVFNEDTGRMIASVSDNDSFRAGAILSGDMLYFYHASAPDYRGRNTYVLSAYDYVNSRFLWARYLDNISVYDICQTENSLILIDSSMINVVDKTTGNILNYYFLESPLIAGWVNNDMYYYINYDGLIHYCDQYRLYDYTEYFFINAPTSKIISAAYGETGLFCKFNEKNYITRYSSVISPEATRVEYDTSYTYKIEHPADDALENIESINLRAVNESFYSDDGKYIFVHYNDHTAKIYDATSMKEIASPDCHSSKYVGLWYSSVTGSYILNGKYESYILNDDLNVICQTTRILDEKGGRLILTDIGNNCFSVPFVNYQELIKRTDEYLKGYEPGESVRQKYNLK
ncbi:MAG: TIR domain-containing protein [Lachnospiraceae bacterium]|nr:TIR domain-containing protein [Lachnospiraceae bacterium]